MPAFRSHCPGARIEYVIGLRCNTHALHAPECVSLAGKLESRTSFVQYIPGVESEQLVNRAVTVRTRILTSQLGNVCKTSDEEWMEILLTKCVRVKFGQIDMQRNPVTTPVSTCCKSMQSPASIPI